MKNIYLTLDVDMADYLSDNIGVNEMTTAVPEILEICKNLNITATWYIRIDDRMAAEYGCNDYIFTEYADIIETMRNSGHEIAWHFHSYIKQGDKWVQNSNESDVAAELNRNWPLAQKHGLKALRMGWAYHTNLTMATVSSFGLEYDSSAFPRPNYPWENGLRNWEKTGQLPYFPSKSDYRLSGDTNFDLLQIPISTVELSSPTDTLKQLLRYINPVYNETKFKEGLSLANQQNLILVMHPYEILPNKKAHSLMSFCAKTFTQNLTWAINNNYKFKNINTLSNEYYSTDN
jgi:hypothetical protein